MLSTAALRFSHLSLGVNDLDVTERFYRDLLGLPMHRNGDELELRTAEMLLVFTPRPPSDRAKFHFGFKAERYADVDSWAQRLREGGAEIVSGPHSSGPLRQLFFLDPDGYEVQIYSDTP